MFDGLALGSVVSTMGPPLKHRPNCQSEEDAIRNERVKLFIYRYENNLDIWSGDALTDSELAVRNDTCPRESRPRKMFTICPYKDNGSWVFDDADVGLVKEPFVAGADVMIDKAVQVFNIKKAEEGFNLTFSNKKFKEFNIQLTFIRAEDGGSVYGWKYHNMEGWLCPALLKYFDQPPENLFVQIKDNSLEGALL